MIKDLKAHAKPADLDTIKGGVAKRRANI